MKFVRCFLLAVLVVLFVLSVVSKFTAPVIVPTPVPTPVSTQPAPSRAEEQKRIKEKIDLRTQQYVARQQKLYREFMLALPKIGARDYAEAVGNVPEVADEMTSMKWCAKLCIRLVKDQVEGTQKATELIQEPLNDKIIFHLSRGAESQWDALATFVARLQENDNQYRAGVQELLAEATFDLPEQQNLEEFHDNINKIHSRITSLAMNKAITAAATAIEVATLKITYKCFVKVAGSVAAKVASKLGIGAIIAAADGPLPIGDLVTVVLAGWTLYDIYDVSVALPREFTAQLNTLVRNSQADVQQEILQHARKALEACTSNTL